MEREGGHLGGRGNSGGRRMGAVRDAVRCGRARRQRSIRPGCAGGRRLGSATGQFTAGGRAIGLPHDVGEESAWERTVAAARETFGALDILVNNAGLGSGASILDTSLDDWHRTMRVNLDGVFLGTRAAVAAMQEAGGPRDPGRPDGAIVNVSSILGLVGSVDVSAYSASKGAVRLFSKSVALECAARGWRVRVNSVHPGYIDPPMVETGLERRASRAETSVDALKDDLVRLHPIGRLGRPAQLDHGDHRVQPVGRLVRLRPQRIGEHLERGEFP